VPGSLGLKDPIGIRERRVSLAFLKLVSLGSKLALEKYFITSSCRSEYGSIIDMGPTFAFSSSSIWV
jgi:hypothetical protein